MKHFPGPIFTRFWLAYAALFLLSGVPAFGATQELLTNGGFETPYNAVSGTNAGGTVSGNFPSGWIDNSRNQGKQVSNVYSQETVDTVSGSALKAVTTAGSGANPLPGVVINQTMNFIPGRTLSGSIWMKASAATTVSMRFFLNSSPYTVRATRTCSVTTSWQKFTLDVTPTAVEVGRLELNCSQAVTLWVDEGSVMVQNAGSNVLVSPSGSDTTGSGTLAAPFQTVAKAMTQVYPGDNILLRAGTYRETIMPLQSGLATAPLTVANYNNEAVYVTGADVISGSWTAAANGVYTTGVDWDLGSGLGQLFVDGVMAHEAREPNYGAGDLLHPTTASMTVTASSSVASNQKVNSVITSTMFSGKPDNFYAGAHLHASVGETWAWQGVNSVASSTGNSITVNAADEYGSWWFLGAGKGYVYGLLSLLDSDNEFYVQNNGAAPHTLSLRITGQGSPATHLVEMRRRTYTIDFNSKNYITIRGLNIRCGDVRMNGTGGVMEECDASHLSHYLTYTGAMGGGGIVVSGTGNRISHCTIHDTAGNGIRASGSNHTFTRNHIYNTDYSGTYASCLNLNGTGHTVTFNTAHHSGRDICQPAGSGHAVMYNEFYEPGQMCKDLAAIYIFAGNAQGTTGGPTRVAYNWVHDNTKPSDYRILIYLDNWCRNFVVDHNVLWNGTGDAGIRMNGPRDGHKIYHNTLYNCNDVGTRTFTLPFDHTGNPDPAFWNTSGSYSVDPRNNLFLGTSQNASLADPANRDFRLKAGAAAIDSAALIAGYNDSYLGSAPDQGAYESGGPYWVPGVDGWPMEQVVITSNTASELSATGATTASAKALATLVSAGTAPTTVTLYYGVSDGGATSAGWSSSLVVGSSLTGSFVSAPQVITGLIPGRVYYYRYRAVNATNDVWSEVQSFTTPATAYSTWHAQYFDPGTPVDPTVSGPAADANGNGMSNLLEYALGGHPTQSASSLSVLPQSGRSAANTLQLSFTRYTGKTDVTLTVQAADALDGLWTPLARSTAGGAFVVLTSGATVSETGTGTTRSVVVTDLYPVTDPAHPRRFMRLHVQP